jgi:type IV pilus assembly protein PilA
MLLRKRKKNEKGFTLVELVVVIAILALLVTLLVPKIMGNVEEARINTELSNARTIASQITVHNAMRKTGVASIPATLPTPGNKTTLTEPMLTASELKLPTGVGFPKPEVVTIVIDEHGNAEIVKTPPVTP